MKKLIYYIIFTFIIIFIPNIIYAVSTHSIDDINEIANFLISEDDDGIEIDPSSIKFHGNIQQAGIFEEASTSNIPGFDNIDNGIVLTTGNIDQNMFAPASTFLCYGTYSVGSIYEQDTTGVGFDPIYIEFDAKSNSNSISFQYIFASEEFDQSPVFNDKMYILYKEADNNQYTNIGINPNYTEDEDNQFNEVSINNLRNTPYHYDNINGEYFGFLGYTPLLTCTADVTPGITYHFLIGVLDIGDAIYDSAILLKAHSISSKKPSPSEVNPNPSTRKIADASKEISAVKFTLQNGTTLNYVIVKKDKKGLPYLVNTSSGASLLINNNNDINKIIYDITLIVDKNLLHGSTLTVEYTIKLINSSAENFNGYEITDIKDERFTYSDDYALLTENGTNKKYGWQVIDNENLKCTSNNSYGIKSQTLIEKKLVLNCLLSDDNEFLYPYENSGKAKLIMSNNTSLNIKFNSGDVLFLPPTGENKSLVNIYALIGILTIVLILIIRIEHKH